MILYYIVMKLWWMMILFLAAKAAKISSNVLDGGLLQLSYKARFIGTSYQNASIGVSSCHWFGSRRDSGRGGRCVWSPRAAAGRGQGGIYSPYWGQGADCCSRRSSDASSAADCVQDRSRPAFPAQTIMSVPCPVIIDVNHDELLNCTHLLFLHI